MPSPYIPAKDVDFENWFLNFSTLLTAAPTTYGLVAGDATAVAALYATWNAAYVLAITPTTRTSVTIADKDAARAAGEAGVRPYAVSISLNSGVADMDKTAIGVTVKKTVPTPVPPPITSPQLALVAATPLQQLFKYSDTSTPTTKAKPPGAIAMQLGYVAGTVPAVDPAQANRFAVVTKSPVAIAIDPADVGKTITWWGRWQTRSGPGGIAQYGPWGASLITTGL